MVALITVPPRLLAVAVPPYDYRRREADYSRPQKERYVESGGGDAHPPLTRSLSEIDMAGDAVLADHADGWRFVRST